MVEIFVGVLAALLARDLFRAWFTQYLRVTKWRVSDDGHAASGERRSTRLERRLKPYAGLVGLRQREPFSR